MKVIVDTAVWSLALRRNRPVANEYVEQLEDLIVDGRVALLGAVRQEVLSGLRHAEQFERLKVSLRAFSNLELTVQDYELASEYFNLCRRNGVQGANTDFLICAAAVRRNHEILTTDKDFESFATLLPIHLLRPAV
ncbi:MAG: PIN domain-containing protein [Deinococcota bacterium]|jgi:predicted nucleic acid-binding protein|nr:PIN domain-containing protein [Deinococcota bacterium]